MSVATATAEAVHQAPESVELRLPDASRSSVELSPERHAELYSLIVHRGAQGLVEVARGRRMPDGKLAISERGQAEWFCEAGDRQGLARRLMRERGARQRELFVTPAALTQPHGLNEAVGESMCAWVDVDELAFLDILRAFRPRPQLVVASGGGGLHAYWRLERPAGRDQIAAANRKLAAVVAGDRQSCNPARLMRLPGSFNWKSDSPAPCRVLWADLATPGHELAALVAGLEDPKAPAKPPSATNYGPSDSDRALDSVPPPEYFFRIAGLAVAQEGGFVSCPHRDHPDRKPSCYVYPERGWYCHSCGVGGGAIHLVAALKGLDTSGLRGEAFKECKREALEALGISEPGSGA